MAYVPDVVIAVKPNELNIIVNIENVDNIDFSSLTYDDAIWELSHLFELYREDYDALYYLLFVNDEKTKAIVYNDEELAEFYYKNFIKNIKR